MEKRETRVVQIDKEALMRDTLESDTSHKTLGADGSRNTLISADATDKKYKTKGESNDERMKSNMTIGSK